MYGGSTCPDGLRAGLWLDCKHGRGRTGPGCYGVVTEDVVVMGWTRWVGDTGYQEAYPEDEMARNRGCQETEHHNTSHNKTNAQDIWSNAQFIESDFADFIGCCATLPRSPPPKTPRSYVVPRPHHHHGVVYHEQSIPRSQYQPIPKRHVRKKRPNKNAKDAGDSCLP